MKWSFQFGSPSSRLLPFKMRRSQGYWSVISFAAMTCCQPVSAQDSLPPLPEIIKPIAVTNFVEPVALTNLVAPVAVTNTPNLLSTNGTTQLDETTVVARRPESHASSDTSIGTSTFQISKAQILTLAEGENAKFNEVLLRTPGVVQDSQGQVHVRGEHGNLQYRINDVLIPEGIAGFGSEISPKFAENFRLITGALPAQYGYRTAGVVDIHTKNGAFDPGGEVSLYGGSYDTINPSFEYGGSESNLNYYVEGSYDHNNLGIENPAPTVNPIHDQTDEYKLFGYESWILDDTSRLSGIWGAAYSDFQIPNTSDPQGALFPGAPGQPATFDASALNERQNEQNYYGILSYQKSTGDLNFQISAYGRESSVHFMPDSVGDLCLKGVSSDEIRHIYAVGENHTLRFGLSYQGELSTSEGFSQVYTLDSGGNPTGRKDITLHENTRASIYGLYLQDEWKLTPKLTLNYGARFDVFASYINEKQLSPRINWIYEVSKSTTLHAGYARYFTPPPLESVNGGSLKPFNGTSNASDYTDANGNPISDPVKSERAHYFDAGFSQKIFPGFMFGADAYYKVSREQLDDGFFGQSLIPAGFNYRKGTIQGIEFTLAYDKGPFSTYANIAFSKGVGSQVDSGQSIVGADIVRYSQNNSIYLDHDQTLTGSFGASYRLEESKQMTTLFFVDALYGSGLRQDAQTVLGTVPNGGTVSSYYSLNTGVEQDVVFGKHRQFKARLDVVNLTDTIYQLRSNSGVGINAPQYGERRGFFGTVSFRF